MQLNAAGAEREPALAPRTPSSRACRQQALLLSENATLLAGPPPLFQWLSPRERELVLSHGRRRVLNHGQTLFSQGTTHEGIYLIESGRIKSLCAVSTPSSTCGPRDALPAKGITELPKI